MGVAPRRQVHQGSAGGDAAAPGTAPREGSSHAAQDQVRDHAPANNRVRARKDSAAADRSPSPPSSHLPVGAGGCSGPGNGVTHAANGEGRGRTPPLMTPIAEDQTVAEERQGWATATQNGCQESDAPPQGSMVFESMRSEPAGTAANPQQWPWQDTSTQLLKSIVSQLGSIEDIYGASPGGDADGELQEQAAMPTVSPPLRPIRDFHAPRTDLTQEEFTLAAVGITISVTDGEPAKIVSAVQGGASVAGVLECDEIVSINGVDVSSAEINGFDCVELCQQAARAGGGSTVTLGVRDFCSMQLKHVHVEVSGGCPAARLLRERNSPRPRATVAPPTKPLQSKQPSPRPLNSPTRLPSQGSIFTHANLDDRPYGSRPSSLHSEDREDDVVMHSTPRSGILQRNHSRDRLLPAAPEGDGEGDGENLNWTCSVPSNLCLKVVGLVVIMGLGGVHILRHVGREEVLAQVISSIDWLEAVLQTLPLCPCTYWIRGSIVTVPMCRVCKPKVLRYHNYNNNAVMALDKRSKSLCDMRPGWLNGKCKRSTETVKYLGIFGTYEECEAACLSYNVGKDRCRALTYYSKTFKERKFRQTCFALTHTGWNKVREYGVTSGRVLGPLSHLQRGLQFVKQELRRRVLLNWWDTGSPMEVVMTMILVIFGLSGIRRPPAPEDGGAEDNV